MEVGGGQNHRKVPSLGTQPAKISPLCDRENTKKHSFLLIARGKVCQAEYGKGCGFQPLNVPGGVDATPFPGLNQ